jgi:hypothetical protein
MGNTCGLARPSDIRFQLFSYHRLAEEEGFEPPELALGGFQDRCLQPLGHSSEIVPEANTARV